MNWARPIKFEFRINRRTLGRPKQVLSSAHEKFDVWTGSNQQFLSQDAILADLINRLHPKWIVKYHEHDSLLQNIESEELTEEEMKAAWEAYEAEKSGQTG